jgi:hypothetical protein
VPIGRKRRRRGSSAQMRRAMLEHRGLGVTRGETTAER